MSSEEGGGTVLPVRCFEPRLVDRRVLFMMMFGMPFCWLLAIVAMGLLWKYLSFLFGLARWWVLFRLNVIYVCRGGTLPL